MEKIKLAAALAIGAATASIPQLLPAAEAAGPTYQVQTIQLYHGKQLKKTPLEDGGTEEVSVPVWTGRACGYATAEDGGAAGEACWDVTLTDTLSPVTSAILDQRK